MKTSITLQQWCKDNKRENLIQEWNYSRNIDMDPTTVNCGSSIKAWWKCSKGHEWQASISTRATSGHGCPYCSHQKVIIGETDLATTNPELVKEWNFEKNKNISIDNAMRGSHHKVWWRCPKGHEWQATIASRACNGRGCPICHNDKYLK